MFFRNVFSLFQSSPRGYNPVHDDIESPDIKPESQPAAAEQQTLQIRIDQLKQFKAEIEEIESEYNKSFFRWKVSTVLVSIGLTAALGGGIGRLKHKFFNPYWEQKDLLYRQRFEFMTQDDDGCTSASFGCAGYYPNFLHFNSNSLANCTQAGYSSLENLVCSDLYIQTCLNIMDTMCNILNSTNFQYVDDETNRHNLETTLNQLIAACYLTPLIGLLMVGLIDWFKDKKREDLVPVSALQKEKLQEYISQIGSDIHLNISKKWFGNEYINSAELHSQIDREITLANARLLVNNIDQDKNNRASFFQPDKDEEQTGINLTDEAVYSV
ncbi:hypothetical protein Lqui_1499 [Legionella quinlivanii]|uniref:Uncharacterized protein n=1 Tax=Legionella quinlivanii TaxID=45073 RepID=A0A0W0Y0U5_9GAMM|nr:hypothetical protein [Legionella quinlivanii]KTD50174.1 hypothetical protein Lqui_1499 [Legionella quinlivanii]SEF48683.1 hypothetical protein SAMN02746093_00338 [Legionella quinlivanii DSM 21216]STY11772.1 Uncharacterised protein [Legionella quinlivanii]